MSGHAAIALVLLRDRGQFATLLFASSENPFHRVKGNLRFPLTFIYYGCPFWARNNTQFDGFEPITLHAARQVGKILKYVPFERTNALKLCVLHLVSSCIKYRDGIRSALI